jgi:predicted alpha/beta hydrolase
MEIRAADGYTLHATLHDANSNRTIVIASAMGVKRRYYDAFAQFLAANGITALTFDYRGIGDSRPRSLRGFQGSLRDWGTLDLTAAIDWISRELRPKQLFHAGHSCGGQIVGLASNASRIDRMLFVCAQSGYWRHWPRLRGLGLGALWYAMPSIARVAGYFPSRVLGLGSEDLPREVATQWATWGRHPDYIFSANDPAPFARLTAPILAWSFEDDHYAPRRAVEALLARYESAAITRKHVMQRKVGHFGFFRKGNEDLWRESLDWLTAVR